MSTLQTLNNNESGLIIRGKINDNFTALNTDKAEKSGGTFTGDISVPDEAYGAGWNGSLEVPTKNSIYDKIETMGGGGSVATDTIWDAKGDLAVGTGANTASRLAVGANGTVLVADSAEATGVKWASVGGTGDVVGPASSTDNALARMDGTTGKVIQNSTVTLSDTGDIAGVNEIQVVELRASTSAGVDVHNNSGTQIAIFGAGGSTGSTLVGTTNVGSASADYHQLSGGTGTITDTATGSSTNININVVPKGTGRFQAGGVTVPTISSTDTLTNKDISSATNTYRSASDTVTGAVELATIAETNTGTDTTRALTPDGLAGSNFGISYVACSLNGTTALTTSDKAYFRIPPAFTGMNLVTVRATVGTGASGSSSSGIPTFTVKNVTDNNQMLSTNLTVDASEYTSATAATAAVINTSFDDVVTDDLIEVACTVAGTGVTYATITLGFQLP